MATFSPGDLLILPRNSHISVISALVLSGALPKYIIPHILNDCGHCCWSLHLRSVLKQIPGISVLDNSSFPASPAVDPLRLTVGFWNLGLSGSEADKILYKDYDVICEIFRNRSITYALNLGTCREHVHRLVLGIKRLAATYGSIPKAEKKVVNVHAPFDDVIMSMIPRDAFFASKRKVAIRESIGEVAGEIICPYPPGVPILIPGEVVTENIVDYLLLVTSKGAEVNGASDSSLSSIVVCGKLAAGKEHP
ncbi:arginine decarboxylase-like [Vigna umbellata]|uniref:arginine decarboxylase-like n=1 Tax=Vigna umbellata TaxID=87088 RepID=UPI001F5F0AB5|nr:arginine decarboxylase-like [Vigna umbellata]